MSSSDVAAQPPPPFFIQTFSEQIERAYLRYRARSTLQKQYKQLLTGADPDSLPQLGRKRVKKSEEDVTPAAAAAAGNANGQDGIAVNTGNGGTKGGGSASASTTSKSNGNSVANDNEDGSDEKPERKAPHIDDVYRLDLSVAKPDAGILAIGDPPSDVYLPNLPSAAASAATTLENRQIIQILLDKTWESDTLFYDLEGLTHHQIKSLSEVEWSRELPTPPPEPAGSSSSGGGGKDAATSAKQAAAAIRNKRKQTAAMVEDERDLNEEIEHIKRSFCDKNRANSLAVRGAAGW